MIQYKPFREVVPDHDDGGGYDLGEHIPDSKDVDAEPHDQLIQSQSHDGCDDEKNHLLGALVFHMEDHVHTEYVIHNERNGESNGGRHQRC